MINYLFCGIKIGGKVRNELMYFPCNHYKSALKGSPEKRSFSPEQKLNGMGFIF